MGQKRRILWLVPPAFSRISEMLEAAKACGIAEENRCCVVSFFRTSADRYASICCDGGFISPDVVPSGTQFC
jgi:hypothetical protein